MKLSDKQWRAFTFGQREGTYFALVGPIRSGKSVSGLQGFLYWGGTRFSDQDFALAAKSGKQFSAVVLSPLKSFCDYYGLTLRSRADHWEIESHVGPPNRFWRVVAGEGGVSSARIEGMTLAGAYVDDACFHPQVLLDTIADRCSVRGAKIVYSLYPQGPFHPFKMDYIDRIESGDKSGEVISFSLADNPSLSQDYIRDLTERYRGQPHEYARRIEGRWAAASGLVYGGFHPHLVNKMPPEVEATVYAWEVASDWASSSVTHALLLGHAADGTIWVADEWRWDARAQGEMLTEQQAVTMHRELSNNGERSIRNWIIDPTADGLKLALRQTVQGNVVDGWADMDEGIRVTARWIDGGKFRFVRNKVPYLLREMGSYTWDERAMQRGEDRPDKNSADGAHGLDALRYFTHTNEMRAANRVSYGVA